VKSNSSGGAKGRREGAEPPQNLSESPQNFFKVLKKLIILSDGNIATYRFLHCRDFRSIFYWLFIESNTKSLFVSVQVTSSFVIRHMYNIWYFPLFSFRLFLFHMSHIFGFFPFISITYVGSFPFVLYVSSFHIYYVSWNLSSSSDGSFLKMGVLLSYI